MAGKVMHRRTGCYPVHRGSPELLAPRVVAAAVDEPGPVCVEGGDYRGLAAGAALAVAIPVLRRDLAWLTTPRPSAETTSRGRDPVLCTQEVPSSARRQKPWTSPVVRGQKALSRCRQ